ncbi:MAG: OmpA family protein [Acidobacteriaceae bacterium]|nr:OmpA family protein [Acidobacteriaceae bacterium]
MKTIVGAGAPLLMLATLAMGVEPNTRTFTEGQQTKVQGVIVARDGNSLKVRANDDSIGTVDLTNETKIQLKRGWGRKTAMDLASLVPGLNIEAQGKGNQKGDLVADKVTFDPNSMRASRQIDARVSPLEARAGSLEGRTGTLEGRAGALEGRAGQIEEQQKQTQQQVGQVKQEADQANQGVTDVNGRVSDLDNYQAKYSETVYFKFGSSALTPDDKQKLDEVAQKAVNEKGYVIEVAGFADTTGKADRNQLLSEARANSVIRYLEQQGNIPIHRILTPAGMGTTHEAQPNDTPEGRKMNRRVEVKVLVNQGIVAGSNQPNGNGAPRPPSDSGK